MIRTIVTTTNNYINIPIPDQYIGKKIEIIAFTIDETVTSDDIIFSVKKSKTFKALSLNTKGFKFNRDEANQR